MQSSMLDKASNVRAYLLDWQGTAHCAFGMERVGATLQACINTPDRIQKAIAHYLWEESIYLLGFYAALSAAKLLIGKVFCQRDERYNCSPGNPGKIY